LPPSAAESLVTSDGSTGREAPETELCLGQVAHRLNRLAVQRAVFRSVAVALLAGSALAACATWLSPAEFRSALAVLGLATLVVTGLSLRALRAGWAHEIEAARWVERKIPLEQRLLTLVSARPGDASARLWPELVADNRAQLGRWGKERLGIAAVPGNVVLLLLALVAAWLFLVPWYEETRSALEMPAGPGAGQQAEQGSEAAGSDGAAAPGAQARLQGGTRGAVPESGLGKSNGEEGGRVPDETMARREQDDGTGQAVSHENGGEGGSAKARPGTGERGRPSDPNAQTPAKGGAQAGGRAVPGGDDPADGPMALGNEDGKKSHAGGAGAGSGKATEELLAKKPLTLDGGRHKARFSLTLGGATGNAGSDGPKSIIAQPRSRIADPERGPQEADRAVRHEEIPAEYETVVKRIFKREP